MKVLWVIHGGEVYGEKRAICSLIQGVQASGWEAQAVSLTDGECVDALRAAGITLHTLDAGDSPGMHLARSKIGKIVQAFRLLGHQFALAPKLRRHIRAVAPDVVHVLDKNILPAVAWAARREGKACFWEMTAIIGTGYPFDLNRRLHKWLFRWLHVVPLANSRFTADTLADAGCPVDVMYLGVDAKRFDLGRRYGVSRESLGVPSDATLFTIVARVDPSKGQRLFWEALLKYAPKDVHLLLVGAAPGSAEVAVIRRLAENAGEQKRLHCVDLTTEPEAYLALADVVVNARIDAEPFGLSTVEGMMMAKPALVHALGGPAETVTDGVTGWHMREATVEGFGAGIERALADRARWADMGQQARREAETHFSLKAQATRYRELVRRHIKP
jgi:glycosyltransferase involved in cell wall biosynthesis